MGEGRDTCSLFKPQGPSQHLKRETLNSKLTSKYEDNVQCKLHTQAFSNHRFPDQDDSQPRRAHLTSSDSFNSPISQASKQRRALRGLPWWALTSCSPSRPRTVHPRTHGAAPSCSKSNLLKLPTDETFKKANFKKTRHIQTTKLDNKICNQGALYPPASCVQSHSANK